MLRIGLAPCSPFTVTNDLMIAAASLARQYEGVRLHTHLAENQVGSLLSHHHLDHCLATLNNAGRAFSSIFEWGVTKVGASLQEDVEFTQKMYGCRPGDYIK